MKIVLGFLITFFSLSVSAQIINDTTVHAIIYWRLGDQYKYTVENETYQVTGQDTTKRNLISYDVIISIEDSTESSYSVRWNYNNFSSSYTDTTIQQLMKISEGLDVIFKTDEFGIYRELVNWKEVKDFMKIAVDLFTLKYQDVSYMKPVLKTIESMYSSRESMEANCTKDIRQFHNFYGVGYTKNVPLEGTSQLPSPYGGDPISANFKAELIAINLVKENYTLKSVQTIDEKQLNRAFNEHFKKLTDSMAKDSPELTIPKTTDENITASLIHNSGWIIDSFQKSLVTIDETIKVETRNIHLVLDE